MTHLVNRYQTQPPASLADLLQRAVCALGLDQIESATQWLDQALRVAPNDVEANRLMGIAALMSRRFPAAVDHLQRALRQRPEDATIHMTLGSALIEQGAATEFDSEATQSGLAHLRRACELAPQSAEGWYNYGAALRLTYNMQPAREALEHALRLDPRHLKARSKLAMLLTSEGDIPAAASTLRETLRQQPDCVDAWVMLANLKTEPFSRADVAQLEMLLARPDVGAEAGIALSFVLARALEDQADYPAAFALLVQANAEKRKQLSWSLPEEQARVQAIAQAFARPGPAPRDDALGKEVIFLVCLPRSGSTLTEQILASHREVCGGEELQTLPNILDDESRRVGRPFPEWAAEATSDDWHRLGKAYLEQTDHLHAGQQRFTDKTINNWAFVGAALAMLPAARVVNTRRDPVETCFACYRQLFRAWNYFSYDLDDMIGYYVGYDRLSALWQQRFPRRYFESHYEALQRDPDAHIRRLLDFCGLAFDPNCLDFHKTRRSVFTVSAGQVRQPVRRDTARSERFGALLDPLREKLQAASVANDFSGRT